jgi:hypothetical protein
VAVGRAARTLRPDSACPTCRHRPPPSCSRIHDTSRQRMPVVGFVQCNSPPTMPARRTTRSRRGSQLATAGSQQPYSQSPHLSAQAATASPRPSMDPVSFPPNRSQRLGASIASQILNAQVAGNVTPSQSKPSVLPAPSPAAAFPEAVADNLSRDTSSADHVRPHSGKLELLDLDEWNENETYDEEPPTCLHYSIK